MFVAPFLRERPAGVSRTGSGGLRRWFGRFVILGVAVVALFVIRVPHQLVLPVQLNAMDRYAVSTTTAGFVQHVTPAGFISAGTPMVTLTNPALLEERRLLSQEFDVVSGLLDAVRGVDPALTRTTEDRLKSIVAVLAVRDAAIAALQGHADAAGFL